MGFVKEDVFGKEQPRISVTAFLMENGWNRREERSNESTLLVFEKTIPGHRPDIFVFDEKGERFALVDEIWLLRYLPIFQHFVIYMK